MTLLITVFAAVVSTAVWYFVDRKYLIGRLALMYWGAALMWGVDAVYEYKELGAAYFTPAAEDMANDAFLGAAAVALGLMIWLAMLLISDPKGTVRKALKHE
ncbi:MAG: hypothetical protein J6I96_03540 [Oscillospiraceae bacterium]|nr:hypothetical protein [Oscillospiraceae bacterium]